MPRAPGRRTCSGSLNTLSLVGLTLGEKIYDCPEIVSELIGIFTAKNYLSLKSHFRLRPSSQIPMLEFVMGTILDQALVRRAAAR